MMIRMFQCFVPTEPRKLSHLCFKFTFLMHFSPGNVVWWWFSCVLHNWTANTRLPRNRQVLVLHSELDLANDVCSKYTDWLGQRPAFKSGFISWIACTWKEVYKHNLSFCITVKSNKHSVLQLLTAFNNLFPFSFPITFRYTSYTTFTWAHPSSPSSCFVSRSSTFPLLPPTV